MGSSLWAMGIGALLLLYGLKETAPARQRQACVIGGGCLFVLGVLFAANPQPWSHTVLWLFAGSTLVLLLFQRLFAPR